MYSQLCVWPATVLGDSSPAELEQYFLEEFNTRVKFHTEVLTLPDKDSTGKSIPNTGGRNDLFFFVHAEDIPHFAIPRLSIGIRWWEDVSKEIYPSEFVKNNPVTW